MADVIVRGSQPRAPLTLLARRSWLACPCEEMGCRARICVSQRLGVSPRPFLGWMPICFLYVLRILRQGPSQPAAICTCEQSALDAARLYTNVVGLSQHPAPGSWTTAVASEQFQPSYLPPPFHIPSRGRCAQLVRAPSRRRLRSKHHQNTKSAHVPRLVNL